MMTSKTKPKLVAVRIARHAHVDEAYTKHGCVTKTVTLTVPQDAANELLESHEYIELVTED